MNKSTYKNIIMTYNSKTARLSLLSATLLIFFSLQTYFASVGEFSDLDLIFISSKIILVALIQSTFIVFVENFTDHLKSATELLCSVFITLNLLSTYLIFLPGFQILSSIQIILITAVIFIILALFNLSLVKKDTQTFIILMTLLVATPLGQLYLTKAQNNPVKDVYENHFPEERLNQIKMIDKPHIVFWSFDALQPYPILASHLGLTTIPAHEEALNELNFYQFKNSFSDYVATWFSIESLFKLSQEYYGEVRANNLDDYLKDRLYPNALPDILKRNGYDTTMILRNNYFGTEPWLGIDNFKIMSARSVCDFIDSKFRKIAFYGHCFLDKNVYDSIAGQFFGGEHPTNFDSYKDMLVTELRAAFNSDTPQFIFAYTNYPGHAQYRLPTVDYLQEFGGLYTRNSMKAAEDIGDIIRLIEAANADVVLFIFGDHGNLLTATFEDEELEVEDNLTFYVRDFYGISAAVYPSERCKDLFDTIDTKAVTTSQIASKLLNCLADRNSPIADAEYHLRPVLKIKSPLNYEDFLYE